MPSASSLQPAAGAFQRRPDLLPQSPATGEALGAIAQTPLERIPDLYARARAAQKVWSTLGFQGRKEHLLRLRDVIGEEIDAIADIISRDNGKPALEAVASEIFPVCYLITHFAKHAQKMLRPERIRLGPGGLLGLIGKKSWVEYEPCGVVAVISPWNYPFSLALGEIVLALAAGNAVINKPSEYTPLVGLKVGELFEKAGFPDGLVTICSGDGAVGQALLEAGPDKVSFTGSVRTGRKVAALCGERLIPCTLELGGKDPALVLADADLKVAVPGVVWGAMQNAGQTCAAVERCYVHRSLHDAFVEQAVALTASLRQGDHGHDRDMGAMTNEMQLKIVEGQVDRARLAGATVHCGGRRNPGLAGWFYEPTVLSGVNNRDEIMQEETFGPVLPILPFESDDDAIAMANDSVYGLCASVWSRDRGHAEAVARRLIAGTVTINDALSSHATCETPWMGVKQSGLGITHSAWGLKNLCRKRHVQSGKSMPQLYWYPYSENLYQTLRLGTKALFGGDGLLAALKYGRAAVRNARAHLKRRRSGAL